MTTRAPRLLVLCAFDPQSTFSYHTAWPRHLAKHPKVRATVVNLHGGSWRTKARALVACRTARFDAVVLLHSVFSNAQLIDGWLLESVQRLAQPKIFFIGNEYKLMPEKMAFAESLPAAMLISQSNLSAVHELYQQRLGCRVTSMPNTGLDPELFALRTPRRERPIDLGYRADDGPAYLGHRERRELSEYFIAAAARWRLTVDISLNPQRRFIESEWAAFLDRCKGQLGSEAGGDYFELDDRTRLAVTEFERAHPTATFEEIHARFFAHYGPSMPMRILSGRQVEAAGTRTVQILLEGRYDGYFEPDVHYIPLKKDFSNADDAIRKFRDAAVCDVLTDNAYRVAIEQLTYERLIDRLADLVAVVV